jgi:hypothetical protein
VNFIYLLLTAIGLMSGGSVYKDHTFNKETGHMHLTNTTQYIARIFTVQVHQHYKTQQKTGNTERKHKKYRRKQDEYTARKRNRAVKPIVRRYIVGAIPTL